MKHFVILPLAAAVYAYDHGSTVHVVPVTSHWTMLTKVITSMAAQVPTNL